MNAAMNHEVLEQLRCRPHQGSSRRLMVGGIWSVDVYKVVLIHEAAPVLY